MTEEPYWHLETMFLLPILSVNWQGSSAQEANPQGAKTHFFPIRLACGQPCHAAAAPIVPIGKA